MSVVLELADLVGKLGSRSRALVAIDGPDAAGKTMLADALAVVVPGTTIRATIDGFHRPREERMARGMDSPVGYYRDSFDYDVLESVLLKPFANGEPTVRTRAFDFRIDAKVDSGPVPVPERAALIFDGIFLLRPDLRHWWTLTVYLHVPEDVTIARAIERDVALFGSPEATETRYRNRYLPGQALYRDEAHPLDSADIVLDMTHASSPRVMKWDIAR